MNSKQWLFIGTYTEPILFGTGEVLQGQGRGIHLFSFDESSGRFAEHGVCEGVKNPSYLCVSPDKRFLYAVNELKEFEGEAAGAVSSFAIEHADGTPRLRFLNIRSTGGTDPCHVNVDAAGRCVFVANFMSGSVAGYRVADDGSLGERTEFIQHGAGSGVDPKRQAGPHAHSAVFTPDGNYLLVPDLGMDKLVVYAPDLATGKLQAQPGSDFAVAPGDGPRFCEFHPNGRWCYLINELGSSVSLLDYHAATGSFTHKQVIATIPASFTGANICADLHLTPDGRYLYASNRGHDSLAAYAVDEASGQLTLLERIPCGGKTPRNFCISAGGGYVLVANQDSGNLLSFRIDYDTGTLQKVDEVAAPTPVCIKPFVL